MSEMFYGLESLQSIDVSSFDTSNVTNMYRMFSELKSLKSLDISNFNIEKVEAMYDIFNKGAIEELIINKEMENNELMEDELERVYQGELIVK